MIKQDEFSENLSADNIAYPNIRRGQYNSLYSCDTVISETLSRNIENFIGRF